MKTVVAVISLAMLACVGLALPLIPEDLEGEAQPLLPLHLATAEEALSDAGSADLVRERRSPGGWQQGGGGGLGLPQPRPQEPRGSISGSVHRQPGVGTVVQAQGQGNVWTSKNGNGRLDAQGDWSKVVSGPGKGKPNYNVGVTYTHRF